MKKLLLILTLMITALPMAFADDEAGATLCNSDRTTLVLIEGFTDVDGVCKNADGDVVDCEDAYVPATAEEN